MSIRLEDLHPSGQRRVLAALDAAERRPAAPATATTAKRRGAPQGQEAKLQRECEQLLQYRGYSPRTTKHLAAGRPHKGWYLHVHRAQGNPYVLDLLILGHDGRWLEVELKTRVGAPSREQRQILEQSLDRASLVRSVEEFRQTLDQWEGLS